jgi:hypothetical protein
MPSGFVSLSGEVAGAYYIRVDPQRVVLGGQDGPIVLVTSAAQRRHQTTAHPTRCCRSQPTASAGRLRPRSDAPVPIG